MHAAPLDHAKRPQPRQVDLRTPQPSTKDVAIVFAPSRCGTTSVAEYTLDPEGWPGRAAALVADVNLHQYAALAGMRRIGQLWDVEDMRKG